MDRPGPGLDDRYRVDTPERIDLEYDVAGIGSRFLAAVVDTAIVTLVAFLVLFSLPLGLAYMLERALPSVGLGNSIDAGYLALAATVLLTFAVIWGYFVFFELVWHGQSPGKRWVGLRVIKEGGYPIGFADSTIRNVIRLADFLPFYYIVGTVAMFLDGRSRRLGDLAAGTLVVKERRELRLESLAPGPELQSTPGGEAEPGGSPFPNLARLTPADQSLLREYCLRRPTLADPAAAALAARLAAVFARKLDYDLADEAPEAFLARLARQARVRG